MHSVSPLMAHALLADPPIAAPELPRVACSLSRLVRELESELGSTRWTLSKVASRDFEARTIRGHVGRGLTPGDAIAELLEQPLNALPGPGAVIPLRAARHS